MERLNLIGSSHQTSLCFGGLFFMKGEKALIILEETRDQLNSRSNVAMWSSNISAYYCCVILTIFSLALASAQNIQYFCVDAGDTAAAPLCNTTDLQSVLPAKVCALSFDQPDWSFYCGQFLYDAWVNVCPKQNFNVEGFCSGTSGSLKGYSCLLKACNTDADCPQFQSSVPVVPAPSQLPCYDCCQTCFDDDYCATSVSNGVYAAPGITSCTSCATSTPAPVATPVTSQSHSRIRFANAQMSDFSRLGLAVSPFGSVPGLEASGNTASDWPVSEYFSLPLPGLQLNQYTSVYLNDLITDTALTVPRNVTLVDNQSYTFIAVGPSEFLEFGNETSNNTQMPYVMFGVAEKPSNPALYAGQALVTVVNAVASSYGSRISLTISEGITTVFTQVSFGQSAFFLPFNQQVDIDAYLDDQTLFIRDLTVTPDATTVVYLRGDLGVGYRWTYTVVPFNAIAPPVQPPVSEPSICVSGFVESTGYCNCYSGFTNDEADSRYKCSIQPPGYCQPLSETSPMENYVVPSIYDLHVSRNNLGLRVTSSFVANRRTLIEFPNPECNLINSPEFFEKTIDGCNDVFIVNAPFANCGFTLTSEEYMDIYSGEMHVKHIDRIVIDDNTIERVVDTPFNVVIRLPKNLAVASSVEIVATPGVPVKAAFISQNVNVATQTGQLEFVTSLPAPLIVLDAQMVEAPYNVNPAVRLIGSNCSAIGYCLQHLVVDLDIQNCSISGVYKMVVTIGCSTQQNCPGLWDSPASTQLTATIAAQPTCGEASIDIGLSGQLQAYNDPTFSSPASSFDNGKTVHFLVSTYSDQVDISSVDLVSVWYTGSNVPGQFLFINDNFTDVGATNNFNYGQHSNSQLWFSFEATVSSPNSTDDTVFKLDKDEVGSYTFVAFIELQWNPNDATPSNANPFPLKKRVALEGTLSRQNSQLSSKVQITGPKNTNEDAVSVSSVVSGSVLALFVALISVALI